MGSYDTESATNLRHHDDPSPECQLPQTYFSILNTMAGLNFTKTTVGATTKIVQFGCPAL